MSDNSATPPENVNKLPSVAEMFGRPVIPKTDSDVDTRSRLLDKTIDDINLDSKFDLSTNEDNRFLFLFSRADTYSELIKKRYGCTVLEDYFYRYKKQSMSKGRVSRQEMVEIIAGRNFPDFDDIKDQYQSQSLMDKLRGVIRR